MSSYRMRTKLSDKPSEIMTQALRDLAKVEKTKGIQVNMGTYFRMSVDSYACEVCLAGAVMYNGCPATRNLEIGSGIRVSPSSFSKSVEAKLRFISSFQFGYLAEALDLLGIANPRDLPRVFPIEAYRNDRKSYKYTIRKFIRKLKSRGL